MSGMMYVVKKREFQLFTAERGLAEIARRSYPQLKGGRIQHVLQLGRVELGKLYRYDELVAAVSA